ncbi:MAG: YhjD/YihY/BrkB family envelope integrity protein, partial [Candidatus Binatia bacterium]
KTLIGLYLGRSAMASAYGAAGALAVVLTWVYYSAMILFFGAELTEVYARRYGSLRPASGSRSGRPVPIRSAKFSQ